MYQPSEKILEKYADVLVNFALNSGKGVKPNEVVLLQVSECAKPLLITLRAAVLKAGAYPIIQYFPDDMMRDFYGLSNNDQLKFFPAKYLRGKIDEIDHSIDILSETDMYELKGIDPKKIMMSHLAYKPYKEWRNAKEGKGKYTWTLALYGTKAMSDEAKMSLEEYWKEIIKACYLNVSNPVVKWKEVQKEVVRVKNKLTSMKIDRVRVKSKSTDLTIGIGEDRQWLAGSGRNIPSFEVFVSPDWRRTEGHIQFTEPLYCYGNLIDGVKLEFEKGLVVRSSAKKGQKVLKEMIATKDADKIGEFSLTDGRLSKITKFMAETLYDENVGGKYGNTHIALGMSYKDSYKGDQDKVMKNEWRRMGYNDSVVHTDIVSTENRIVTAYSKNGSSSVIYKGGKFTI